MKQRKINQKSIEEKWYLIDATGLRIGKVATKAAELLLDKGNPLMRDYLQPNTKVIITNAEKIDFTEKKGFSKFYQTYSGYPGGLKRLSLEEQIKKNPTYPLERAIKGMLPKNKRGKAIVTNLKLYSGSEHVHTAQNPQIIEFK